MKFGWKKDTSLFLQFQRKTFGVVFEYAALESLIRTLEGLLRPLRT